MEFGTLEEGSESVAADLSNVLVGAAVKSLDSYNSRRDTGASAQQGEIRSSLRKLLLT